jgi:hypothetical protein
VGHTVSSDFMNHHRNTRLKLKHALSDIRLYDFLSYYVLDLLDSLTRVLCFTQIIDIFAI